MRKTKKLSNLLHTYCDVDHARDISNRQSVTSTVHIFNGTIINWSAKKQSETSRSSPNAETRAMYTGVLDQNCIRELFIPTGCPLGPPSEIYEDNQATIKRVLADIITPQARPLDFLINALHKLHPRKTFEMVDTRSNMQLADLNSKPHGRKSIQNIIDRAIGAQLYPPSGSLHYNQLRLSQFHDPAHINCEQKKKSEIKKKKISSALNRTTKSHIDQI